MLKKILILIIPTISLLVAILTLKSYGINWDEPYHYRRGQAFLQYYLTGLKTYQNMPKYPPLKGNSDNPDFRNSEENFLAVQKNPNLSDPNFRRSFYQDDSWNGEYSIDIEKPYGHPPLNGILAAGFNKIFYQKLGILGDLESYRLFIIALVSLSTFAIAFFMWKEFGIIESVFTSLAFTIYPLVIGEQHFNIKDPIEMSFYTITILTAYLGVKKNKFIWLLISVLCFSFALSTKFNIAFSLIPITLWFIYYLLKNKNKIDKKKLFRNIGIVVLIAPFIILGVLILSYPTLWKDPVGGIAQIVKFYLEVGYPKSLPAGYYYFGFLNMFPLVWITFTTPPIEIFLFLISVIFSFKLVKKNSFVLLLFLWILVTIGRNSFFNALNYGGVRLIMEYVPALAMLSGIAAGYLVKLNKKYIAISSLVILLAFVPTILKLIKIHPNENTYFNFLINGLAGAKAANIPAWGDSYGNAYYQGVEWLNANAEKNAKVSVPVGNTSNIPRFKLRPDIAVSPYYWSGLNHNGEYLIELTYDYLPMNYFALKYLNEAMLPVYEVKVDGVAIAKVWKNDTKHIKSEFTKTKDILVKTKSDPINKTLELTLVNPEKLMAVKIEEPVKKCTPLKTGYVTTSLDGKNWTREPEDIAGDQLNREATKKLEPIYEFYFVAKDSRIIRFNVDDTNNCLLKATQAFVTVLN